MSDVSEKAHYPTPCGLEAELIALFLSRKPLRLRIVIWSRGDWEQNDNTDIDDLFLQVHTWAPHWRRPASEHKGQEAVFLALFQH